jgi:hypothetical protein
MIAYFCVAILIVRRTIKILCLPKSKRCGNKVTSACR